jgi:hypothetical protein
MQPSRLNRVSLDACRISTMDCRTSEEPFLGRQDTRHLPVCCTIQNKAQDLKAVEETVEGLQRLKTAEGMLSLAENCGGFWKRDILFDIKRQKGDGRRCMRKQDDAFTIT